MNQQDLVSRLAGIPGVTGAVIVTTDGVVMAHQLPGDVDRHAATAALIGAMATQVGQTLGLGSLSNAVVTMSNASMLVAERPDCYVGLVLDQAATPAAVMLQMGRILR